MTGATDLSSGLAEIADVGNDDVEVVGRANAGFESTGVDTDEEETGGDGWDTEAGLAAEGEGTAGLATCSPFRA